MTAPIAGYKGDIYIGAQKIGGGTAYSYNGETRNMGDIDSFGSEHVFQLPLQLVGGNVSINGHLKMGDAGQILLESYLKNATPITDLKLYINKAANTYWTPDASVMADGVASHCIITNAKSIGDERSGIATFSATLKVNGELKRVS